MALTDHLGSVRDIVNSAGVVENHKSYDAFGNVTAETNAAKDAVFGFTGKLFDDATGLQNNLHRWYDAAVGRWMSEDPIGFAGGDANLYRYVENQSTTTIDPSGLVGGAAVIGGGSFAGTIGGGGAIAGFAGGFAIGGAGYGGYLFGGWLGGNWTSDLGAEIGNWWAPFQGNIEPMPGGNNQAQNRKFEHICNQRNLTKDQREQLHREISGENYTLEEIEDLVDQMFPPK